LALVRNAPPVTFSRLPFAESRKPLVRVRLAGSHGPVDPGHRTTRQRGLIVVIFDPAPLVRAPAQQTKAQSAELENGQSGAHSRMMAIYAPNSSQPSAKQELLSYLIGAVMLLVLIYGCVQFYDASFRDCASGYSGNCGKFHTAVEDRAFGVWQAVVLIVWPIGMGALIFLQRNRLRV
jgi:hypothetical protein